MMVLTPKTLRDPLLKAMGALSELTAGTPVSQDDAVAEVCRELGITEEDHGVDTDGRPKVRVWATLAFNRKLKKNGFADGAGRGRWALTEKGVEAAKTLMGDIPMETTQKTQVPEENGVAAGGGVSWAPGSQTNTYHKDRYIQALAVSSTKCFGHWSIRSEKCKECPVAGACKAELTSTLSRISASLRERDEREVLLAKRAAERPVQVQTSGDEDIEDILAAIEGDFPQSGQKRNVVDMAAAASSKCAACGKTVPQGSKAKWERGVGLYHPECFKE